jgi:hypothetical protein
MYIMVFFSDFNYHPCEIERVIVMIKKKLSIGLLTC